MSFAVINSYDLAPISFIGGTEQELTFYLYDSASQILDLTSASWCGWEMGRYGSASAVLTKDAVVSGSPINKMVVILTTADTQDLSGKFIHQPVTVDNANKEFRPSQGSIQISSRIS